MRSSQIKALSYKTVRQLRAHCLRLVCLIILPVLILVLMITFSAPDAPWSGIGVWNSSIHGDYPFSNQGMFGFDSADESVVDGMTAWGRPEAFSHYNHSSSDTEIFTSNLEKIDLYGQFAINYKNLDIDTNNRLSLNLDVLRAPTTDARKPAMTTRAEPAVASTNALFYYMKSTYNTTVGYIKQKFGNVPYLMIYQNKSGIDGFTFMIILTLHLMFIVDCLNIYSDIKSNMIDLLKLSGMDHQSYIMSSVLVFAIFKVVVFFALIVYMYFSKFRPFYTTVLLYWLVGFIFVSIALSMFSLFFTVLTGKMCLIFGLFFAFIVPSIFDSFYDEGDIFKMPIYYRWIWLPTYLIKVFFQNGILYSLYESKEMTYGIFLEGPFLFVAGGTVVCCVLYYYFIKGVMSDGWKLFFDKLSSFSFLKKKKKTPIGAIDKELRVSFHLDADDEQFVDPDCEYEHHRAETCVDDNVILRASHIVKIFNEGQEDEKVAVDDVSICLEKGKVMSFLGPSGAGKTTSIHCILGMLEKNHGEIYFKNERITKKNIHDFRMKCGVVPQETTVWEDLTVEDHLVIFAMLKNVKTDIGSKVEATLRVCNLLQQRYKLANALSGGFKRCLMIAVALCSSPEVVLFDECFVGIAIDLKSTIQNIIRLQSQRCAILITSHSLLDLELVADKTLIINDGAMQAVGDISDLKRKFDKGVQLSIALKEAESSVAITPSELVHRVSQVLGPLLEKSNLISQQNLVFKWKMDISHHELAVLFGNIRKLCEDELNEEIRYWSISPNTLEDVFLTVTEG
ncbi:hypothetical protein PCE1_002357 [Barthelona sp. PCE]